METTMREKIQKNIHQIRDVHKTIGVMLEIADAVNRTTNLSQFYKAIHTSLAGILNVDNFFIAIHHPDQDKITVHINL